ncbi:MAG: MaoC family dehydratase [Limnohabitans sp.]|jgi:acyl dehydratase|nr:MaoC family dehydratase [Burkholderiaceae bacterium]
MKVFASLQDVASCVGQEVAVSEWTTITQAQIDQFAQATGDHQWIHVDPQRAAEGPFGTTIAHGYLTLSLVPKFFDSAMRIDNVRMSINYGLNKVRFMAPVPVNSRLRARISLVACDPVEPQGFQQTWQVQVEREGSDKPVCVAESIARRFA